MTTNKAQAEEWRGKKPRVRTITQFDIPNAELDKLNIKVFESANDEWVDFVTQGRRGTLTHSYDAVSGPVVVNPSEVRNGKLAVPKPGKSQFAIFSDKAVALFERFRVRGC